MKTENNVWFARGGGIARMGPFESYEVASQKLISIDGEPVEGAFVWAEPDFVWQNFPQKKGQVKK